MALTIAIEIQARCVFHPDFNPTHGARVPRFAKGRACPACRRLVALCRLARAYELLPAAELVAARLKVR